MKILGVHNSHDSGAAIIEDGKILAAVNEERLNRVKMYWGVPELSIKEVFRIAKVSPKDIDYVAFSNITPGGGAHGNFSRLTKRIQVMNMAAKIAPWLVGSKLFADAYRAVYSKFRKGSSVLAYLQKMGVEAPVKYVEHHQCHAASAFYTAPFDADTMLITTDGTGDGYCSSVNIIEKDYEIKRVAATPFFHSPAAIYAYITWNLGFEPNKHEGKITGLAAYGKAERTYNVFRRIMQVSGLHYKTVGLTPGHQGCRKLQMMLINKKWEDIAAGLQKRFEEVIAELTRNAIKKYPRKNVAVAGGAYANVKANQRIAEINGIKKLWVHPHMGDGGLAVGAALQVWADAMLAQGKVPKPVAIDNVYFGPEYSDEQIEAALRKNGLKFKQLKNVETEIANLIKQKKIIGRFNGRMEYGPRALGNRSILADPTDKTINDWLNKRLKRTDFMPFAPSIMREYAEQFYKNFAPGEEAAQFMTITFDVTEHGAKKAAAVNHIDNTARPQTVTRKQNKSYYEILKAYKDVAGLPIFVNTSFNMHEEPIICSPEDAVRAFKQGSVDVLAIGDYLAYK
ncbi:hypothetical protein HYV81_03540 [Candidatus Woesearchaeota archaeon]|nr:hypothetical protein [Candidatus Woesearchaeota archaeon]